MVVGTRPEGIKMAPVYRALQQHPDAFEPLLCSTGQHREMLESVLAIFDLKVDYQLDLLGQRPDLPQLASRAVEQLRGVFLEARPDWVVCQGDTTTAFCAALAAFYMQIPVVHVEAGLRTYDLTQPFPEEANRRLIAPLARLHFAPTEAARQNLLAEGFSDDTITVTGNTSIDALRLTLQKGEQVPEVQAFARWYREQVGDRRCILVTGHRRENWGAGLENMCGALHDALDRVPDAVAVYPVHLNPRVQQQALDALGHHARALLIPPLDYAAFVWLMNQSHVILTDSGGIQEEAPGLGKPVLVSRNVTERPEGIDAGTALLVGNSREVIREALLELLQDEAAYDRMARAVNPYGDGHAAERIADTLMCASHSEAVVPEPGFAGR